jgi:N utilization substance protein A
VPDFQLSLAIGKEGQNARLAAKLTGWKVDIKKESESVHTEEELEEIDNEAAELTEKLNELDDTDNLEEDAENTNEKDSADLEVGIEKTEENQ